MNRWCWQFHDACGAFPRERQWSRDLIMRSVGSGDFLDEENLGVWHPFFDGWRQPFKYRCPGKHNPLSFDLYSIGPNGKDEQGEGDDIGNWTLPRDYMTERGAKFENPRTIGPGGVQ